MLRIRTSLQLSILLLGLGIVGGCKSAVPQPPQAQTAGLRIDVVNASYSTRRQRIDVRVRIWNDHEQRANFELGNVRLMFNEREVSPTPTLTKDPKPDVQAKSNRTFDWVFEVGEVIGEGTYDIQIRDILKGDMPLGETAAFKIVLAP
jgi:hypothetical protein